MTAATTDWATIEHETLMYNVARTPVTLVRGQGARVWDDEGREYLDFVAGWAVLALGHSHPAVVAAVQQQAANLIHTSNQFYTIPQIALGRKVLAATNDDFARVFFGNSGAEANEGAVKLARKYGKLHRNGAFEVISTLKGFHGRTLAMVAATGKPHYQAPFTPLPEGFLNVPYNDLDAVKAATTGRTVAVLVEPVQGEGGVNPATVEYLRGLRAWCDDNNLLLIFDEVQTGIGRCGAMFAYQVYGVTPDVMTLAKGLGGGLPIGAILANTCADVFAPGDHGSTFGGNPLSCAAAGAVIDTIEADGIAQNAARVGDYLSQKMHDLMTRHPAIIEERGLGLLRAIEFAPEHEVAGALVAAAAKEGLLINQISPTVIRFMPPLIITPVDVDEASTILERVLVAHGL